MKHILMIDDVATNLICAEEVLKDHYRVSVAKSGKKALNMIRELCPDLILLDIIMPEMNGYEVMKCLKEEPELANIPVILVTADADRETETKGFEMGATDYIRKPFEPEVMCSKIERALQSAAGKQ